MFGGEDERLKEAIDVVDGLYGLKPAGIDLPRGRREIGRLVGLIYQSQLLGGELTIASPVCPDYSYHLDSLTGRRVYDFRRLGEGVPLTASVLVARGVGVVDYFRGRGINLSYQLLMADVEADDGEILETLGLEKEEFLTRLGKSAVAVEGLARKKVGDGVVVSLLSSFLKREDHARAERVLGVIRGETVKGIAVGRAGLYLRWFNPQSFSEQNDLVLRRARVDILKYLAFGSAARREGVVVLEATAPQIASLYNFGDGLPPVPVFMVESKY